MKIKINKKFITGITIIILFSIVRSIYIGSLIEKVDISLEFENKYSLLSFQFGAFYLLVTYLSIYIFLLVGELKKYNNSNYISRFNKLNKYNYFILKKIVIFTFKYIVILAIVNWIEANLRVNILLDFNLYVKYIAFLFSLFLALLIVAYIYIFITNLLNEIFAIFIIIILNMLEYLEILKNFLISRLYVVFSDINFYHHQIWTIIYLLIIFSLIYFLNNELLNNIDIQRGEYEQ